MPLGGKIQPFERLDPRTNRREFREQKPAESVSLSGADGPAVLWPGLRVIGAGWGKVANGAFHTLTWPWQSIFMELWARDHVC